MGHLRLTSIGYLKATVAHIRVTLGHLRVSSSFLVPCTVIRLYVALQLCHRYPNFEIFVLQIIT